MEGEEASPGEVAEAVVAGIRTALATDVVAIWLYGSALSGDFEREQSDIDLIAVTTRSIDSVDLRPVKSMHRELVAKHVVWADRIEVVYVARSTLESFRTSEGTLAVISPGEPLHIRDERAIDWLQNWYLARESGKSLYGPDPADVIAPIEWSEFVTATVTYAQQVRDRNRADSSVGALAYDILTMCRAFTTVRLGETSSKLDGAACTSVQMLAWRWLIDTAVDSRQSGGCCALTDASTRAATETFVGWMAVEIRAASLRAR